LNDRFSYFRTKESPEEISVFSSLLRMQASSSEETSSLVIAFSSSLGGFTAVTITVDSSAEKQNSLARLRIHALYSVKLLPYEVYYYT